MRILKQRQAARAILAALYGLAMLLLPLAHRAITASESQDLTAFALPDGSLPEICASNKKTSDKSPGRHASPCDACLLAGTAGLPVNPVDLNTVLLTEPLRHGSRPALSYGERLYVFEDTRQRAPPSIFA